MPGESLKGFFTALQKHPVLQAGGTSSQRGWRSVFGQARREEVESVDEAVAKELERIDPDEWQ
jgi:nitroimidazol reductase NimA-like FMN-containing flavoprotein (pyridoxamine 5'-phosphate oxidase superfamily)